MARPKKIGLDYFPVDVSFNEQIQALESVHGNDGFVWIIKFWQAAYKTETGEVDLRGLFGDISAKNSRITTDYQQLIVKDCIGQNTENFSGGQGMSEIIKTETRIDYSALTAEVNKRLSANHAVGYVRSVHKKIATSAIILATIEEILKQ